MAVNPVKLQPWVAMTVMVLIAAGYFVFLYASWHDFQQEKITRDRKINELLEAIPKPPKVVPND